MDSGETPPQFPVIWASGAGAPYVRNIPVASQIGINDGFASLTTGFVPLNMLPVEAGGVPPFGQDTNGILRQIVAWAQWLGIGAPVFYDAAQATAIGGYPKGTLLCSTSLTFLWRNLVEDNTTDPDAGGAGWVREGRIRLAANTTFYISTTGSDANDGLSLGTAWATRQHAWEVLQQNYDLAGYAALIQVADGAYTDSLSAEGAILGSSGADSVVFQGNVGTPANCTITVANNNCFYGASQAAFRVQGFKCAGTGSSTAISAIENAVIQFSNMDFGAFPAGQHISLAGNSTVDAVGDYTISGGAQNHVSSTAAAVRFPSTAQTITLVGTPAFTDFMIATNGSIVGPYAFATTFVGSATGRRYTASLNGVINTSGSGASYLPGNAAGQTLTGGQYA